MMGVFRRFMGESSPSTGYVLIIPLLSVYFVTLLLISYIRWQQFETIGAVGSIELYYGYSRDVIQGKLPYRDFSFEYPPLGLLPMILPHLLKFGRVPTLGDYTWGFMLENAVMSLLLALTLLRIGSSLQLGTRCLRVLAVYSLLSLITFPLLLGRYDLFPTLLMGLAVAAALAGYPTRSGIWLGLGAAAKLFPVVLLPVLAIYYLVGKNPRALLKLVAGLAFALCLVFLPFLYIGTEQLLPFLDYHRARGLQIESVAAGIVLLSHVFTAAPVTVVYNFGAAHLNSSVADYVLELLPYVTILAVVLVIASCLMCFRHELKQTGVVTRETLLVCLMSIILTFIVTSKVFSPQFISWLLPFASFLKLPHILLVIIIFAMTLVLYPVVHADLLALRTPPILLLNLRNLLTIVLLIWLLRDRFTLWNTGASLKAHRPSSLLHPLRTAKHQ